MKKIGVLIIGIFLILGLVGMIIGVEEESFLDSTFPVLTGPIGGGGGGGSQTGCDCEVVDNKYNGIACGKTCGGEAVDENPNGPGAAFIGEQQKKVCEDREIKDNPSCGCYSDINPTTGTTSGSSCKAIVSVNKNDCSDINDDGEKDSFVNSEGKEQCCFVSLDFMKRTTPDGCPDAPPLRDIPDLIPPQGENLFKRLVKQVKTDFCYYVNFCAGFDSVKESTKREKDNEEAEGGDGVIDDVVGDEGDTVGDNVEDPDADGGVMDVVARDSIGGTDGDAGTDGGDTGTGYNAAGLSSLNLWEFIKNFFKGIF